MELEELDDNELAALVALLRTVVLSNGHVRPEEAESLQALIDAVGEEAYQRVLPSVEGPLTDEAALREFLKRVKRQDARDLIYGTVLEASLTDAIEAHESPLMAWLAETWKVEVQVQGDD